MQNSFIDFLVELKLHGVLVWGSSSGAEFGPLIPASSYWEILDNFMLSTLWGRFGDGLSLLDRCCTPAQRGRSTWMRTLSAEEVDCLAQPHRLTTFHIHTYLKCFPFSIQPQFFFPPDPFNHVSLWENCHFISPHQTVKRHGDRLAGIWLLPLWATLGECCRDVMTARAQTEEARTAELPVCSVAERFFAKMTTTTIADTKSNLPPPLRWFVCVIALPRLEKLLRQKTVFNQLPQGSVVKPVWPQ